MKFIWLVSLILFGIIPSLARAGNELGNGGDSYAQEFVALGRELVNKLKEKPDPKIPDPEALARAVDNTTVVTMDNLELHGASVDALNYPDENKIELNRKRWSEYSKKQKTALVLHEYLGISKTDDNHYQISSAFSEITEKRPKLEIQLHSGYSSSSMGMIPERPLLGGYLGYILNDTWSLGVGIDSYRFKSGYFDNFNSNLTMISIFGKYKFGAIGKFHPYVMLGATHFSHDYEMSNEYWGTTTYPLVPTFGASAALGITYELFRDFSLDFGLNGSQELSGHNTTLFSKYSTIYSGQLGISCVF